MTLKGLSVELLKGNDPDDSASVVHRGLPETGKRFDSLPRARGMMVEGDAEASPNAAKRMKVIFIFGDDGYQKW